MTSGLDHETIMDLSRREAEKDAALMWDQEKNRKQYDAAVERLTMRYYYQRVTPPRLTHG